MSHPEFLLHSSHRDEIWVEMIHCVDLHAVGMLYNAYRWHAKTCFLQISTHTLPPNGAFLKFGMTHVFHLHHFPLLRACLNFILWSVNVHLWNLASPFFRSVALLCSSKNALREPKSDHFRLQKRILNTL